jgi:hypothetical protein
LKLGLDFAFCGPAASNQANDIVAWARAGFEGCVTGASFSGYGRFEQDLCRGESRYVLRISPAVRGKVMRSSSRRRGRRLRGFRRRYSDRR